MSTPNYQLTNPPFEGMESRMIHRIDTGSWIPMDPANTDYQEYLDWLAEGNTPLPAES